MKVQSPAHRLIQLRRKTQKIMIPKANWDLSNKENCNVSNNNDMNRSKNSSKKNSMQKQEKKISMKKALSASQNMLKCTLKNITKNSAQYKQGKDSSSLEKKRSSKKSQSKIQVSIMTRNFAENMNNLLQKVKNNQHSSNVTLQYAKQLMKFTPSTENQRIIFSALSQHLILWLQKFQDLQSKKAKPFSKLVQFDQVEYATSQQRSCEESEQSQEPSMCSYIVDPKQQVKMKPMREELKQQLHLDFAKVDYIRKKQIQ